MQGHPLAPFHLSFPDHEIRLEVISRLVWDHLSMDSLELTLQPLQPVPQRIKEMP